jgi:hypothetical protein
MKRFTGLLALGALVAALTASSAFATHSWGGYHWARTSNPFTVKVGNNLSAGWQAYLTQASSAWNQSTVAKNMIVSGMAKGRCRPTSGRDEVCDASYGNTGWLGVASIWLASGSSHITQGTVKLNDTYFNTSTYDNPNERAHVICQEIGHTWGLDHQDTSGAAYYTCMDYFSNTGSNATSSTSTAPNTGDYDELLCIYDPGSNGLTLTSMTNGITHSCTGTGHNDSSTTVGAASSAGAAAAEVPWWANPSESVYVDHLANGETRITYVLWANPLFSFLGNA